MNAPAKLNSLCVAYAYAAINARRMAHEYRREGNLAEFHRRMTDARWYVSRLRMEVRYA